MYTSWHKALPASSWNLGKSSSVASLGWHTHAVLAELSGQHDVINDISQITSALTIGTSSFSAFLSKPRGPHSKRLLFPRQSPPEVIEAFPCRSWEPHILPRKVIDIFARDLSATHMSECWTLTGRKTLEK